MSFDQTELVPITVFIWNRLITHKCVKEAGVVGLVQPPGSGERRESWLSSACPSTSVATETMQILSLHLLHVAY